MYITAILRLEQPKTERIPLSEADLQAGYGLLGDIKAGPGDRQVPICCESTWKRLARGPGDGLCFARFSETLRFAGLDTGKLESGDLLKIGTALLRVSPARKRCFPECPMVMRGERCDLSVSVRFCTVEESGTIRLGDIAEQL